MVRQMIHLHSHNTHNFCASQVLRETLSPLSRCPSQKTSVCVQVQRYSGAFLMSARKQASGLRTPSSAMKTAGAYTGSPGGSPLSTSGSAMQALLARAGSEQLPASTENDDLGELAEDEEFAVEEHAHRSGIVSFPKQNLMMHCEQSAGLLAFAHWLLLRSMLTAWSNWRHHVAPVLNA